MVDTVNVGKASSVVGGSRSGRAVIGEEGFGVRGECGELGPGGNGEGGGRSEESPKVDRMGEGVVDDQDVDSVGEWLEWVRVSAHGDFGERGGL